MFNKQRYSDDCMDKRRTQQDWNSRRTEIAALRPLTARCVGPVIIWWYASAMILCSSAYGHTSAGFVASGATSKARFAQVVLREMSLLEEINPDMNDQDRRWRISPSTRYPQYVAPMVTAEVRGCDHQIGAPLDRSKTQRNWNKKTCGIYVLWSIQLPPRGVCIIRIIQCSRGGSAICDTRLRLGSVLTSDWN